MKTKHTATVGETYLEHLLFALAVSIRLWLSSFFFFIHALIPWVPVPPNLDLGRMSLFLMKRNRDRMTKKQMVIISGMIDTEASE